MNSYDLGVLMAIFGTIGLEFYFNTKNTPIKEN